MSESPNKIDRSVDFAEDSFKHSNAGSEIFNDVNLSVLLDFEKVQCEGDPDLIVELIDLYLEEVPQQLSAIKDFVLKADESSLKRAVHNLKGSSSNLGVLSISKLCEELEQMNFTAASLNDNFYINQLEQAFTRVRRIFSEVSQDRVREVNQDDNIKAESLFIK